MGPTKEVSERIDLGLALLQRRARYDVPLTLDDIAAWCECSPQAIQAIYEQGIRKVRRRLGSVIDDQRDRRAIPKRVVTELRVITMDEVCERETT